MQAVSSRIWTRVAVSISYDDNHYTTGTFIEYFSLLKEIDIVTRVKMADDTAFYIGLISLGKVYSPSSYG